MLRDLHEQAREWLVSHGYEAEAVLGRAGRTGGKQGNRGKHVEDKKHGKKSRPG